MEQPIITANYLCDVEDIVIDINNLPFNDKLLWDEVEKLLKDNELWDDEYGYYKHAKRIYVVTTEHYDFNDLIKNKNLWANDITKEVVYPISNSLYRYTYIPAFTENYFYTNKRKWYLELPFKRDEGDEGDEWKTYNYIIIILNNDNVIVGRYGNAFWGLGYYYLNKKKQVCFDKLNEPYKSLIIKKLFEEEKQGYNMENLIHLYSKNKEFDITNVNKDDLKEMCESDITEKDIKKYKKNYPQEYDEIIKTKILPTHWGTGVWEILEKIIKEEEGKNLLQENILREEKKGNVVMNDPLHRGQFPVSITSSPIRQFSGTIGLLYNNEGYYDYGGEKKLSWSLDDVKELIRKYSRQRSIDKKFNLCIGLSNIETLHYTWEDVFIEEPIVRVYGEIVSRHEGIPDEEILNALFELFTYLKVDLKQHSVRFNYQGFTEHKSYRIGDGN